jgi:hypothetical protein
MRLSDSKSALKFIRDFKPDKVLFSMLTQQLSLWYLYMCDEMSSQEWRGLRAIAQLIVIEKMKLLLTGSTRIMVFTSSLCGVC